MFNYKKLISQDYLFNIDTVLMHRSDRLFLSIGIALVVIGIVMILTSRFSANPYSKKYWQRLANMSLVIGLLELVWYAFRYEYIRGFGSHIVAIAILIIGAVWTGYILKYRLTKYRSEIESWNKDQLKQKYINMNK